MAELSSDSSFGPPLSEQLRQGLRASIRGPIYFRGDPSFGDYSTVFNGNVFTLAKAVACPLNAEDVSKLILFCTEHSLTPSVKSGGYGTAGWAIGGDVIIDMSKIVDIDIEPPQDDGSFTSLRDMPSFNSKGKGKLGAPVPVVPPPTSTSGTKRRREDGHELRGYDAASHTVGTFLRGPPLPFEPGGRAQPANRRRLNPEAFGQISRQVSDSSASDSGNSSSSAPSEMSVSTVATSPSPAEARGSLPFTSPAPAPAPDPFGYMTANANDPKFASLPLPPSAMQSAFPPRSMFGAFAGGSSSTVYGNPSMYAAPHNILTHTHVEPVHPFAFVTFGAGKRQKEIDIFTAENPLQATSVTGASSTIPYHVPFAAHPVGSTIMLLGGFGFLGRLHGLSIDNLVEVEMVLADGRIVIVNENEHPDLWWALRGAGAALGVAVRYKARAFPVPVVFAGNIIYRFHRATAPSLIRHFRDCVKGAPRELYANVLLTAGPAGQDSLVVIQMCYIGSKEKGQEYLAAISSWDGEKCLLNEVDEKSFLHQQDSVAQVLRAKAGRQWFIRSALITSLPDDIINATVTQFADTPIGCTWLFELAGGAIADFEDTCLPKSQREASFTIAALHQWDMGIDDPRCIESAEEWIADTLKPVQTGGPYPSFIGRHEPADRTSACFGNNWERLCEIKRMYDPTNVFRNSFWPLNAEGGSVDPRTHEPPTPEDANRS